MSGVAAAPLPSPRPSKSLDLAGHNSHAQTRQHHTGPTPAQLHYGFPPSTAPISLVTPSIETSVKQDVSSGSPAGYFGLVLDPNDQLHAQHSKKNWSPASSSIRSAAARSPRPVQIDNPSTPFQKQAEVLSLSLARPVATGDGLTNNAAEPGFLDQTDDRLRSSPRTQSSPDYFSTPRTKSPTTLNGVGGPMENWPSISAPTSLRPSPQLKSPPLALKKAHGRSSTLPNPPKEGEPNLITSTRLSELLSSMQSMHMLLLDIRTYKLYADSRIKDAVNLCIPTTLLKRPSFNVTKLSETFANDRDKDKFARWKEMEFIIVYDADSKDCCESSALAALHTLSKFSREGWKGKAYILKGLSTLSLAEHANQCRRVFRFFVLLPPASRPVFAC